MFRHNSLKILYLSKINNTRNRSLPPPKVDKKNNVFTSVRYYNELADEHKVLGKSQKICIGMLSIDDNI